MMRAVFKREFKSFFTTPVGYFVFAILFCFSGYFFFYFNLYMGSVSLSGVYNNLYSIVMLLVLPILTMRLFSDDKRQKTDQVLLTSPVSLTGIALGKFFAALLVFAIGLAITLVYAIVIGFQVSPDWMVILSNYLGLVLLGGMVIAAGMFFSCLTESQFIAALSTFAFSFALVMLDSVASIFDSELLSAIIGFFSITERYTAFTTGLICYDHVIYFLSMQALFIFLTVRVLDRRRWS